MASLDTGTGIDEIHDVCATIFFILMIISFWITTCYLNNMYKISPKIISKSSLNFKNFVAWGLLFTVVYAALASLLADSMPTHEGKEEMEHLANSGEWVGVTFICLYLGSLSWDWPEVEITLTSHIWFKIIYLRI